MKYVIHTNTPEQKALAIGLAIGLGIPESQAKRFIERQDLVFLRSGEDTGHMTWHNEIEYAHSVVEKGEAKWVGVVPPLPVYISGVLAIKNTDGTVSVGNLRISPKDYEKLGKLLDI